METKENRQYKLAYRLSLFTIFYNIIEGIVSMILGYNDETLTLFGFGADSFIEVMSGTGITIMILRIRHNPNSPKSTFEITAFKITGYIQKFPKEQSLYLPNSGKVICLRILPKM